MFHMIKTALYGDRLQPNDCADSTIGPFDIKHFQLLDTHKALFNDVSSVAYE